MQAEKGKQEQDNEEGFVSDTTPLMKPDAPLETTSLMQAVPLNSTNPISPDFICVGNGLPENGHAKCFIHFIYTSVERASAAAKKLQEQHEIQGYLDYANKGGKRPLRVHHKAGDVNVPKSYSDKNLAFIRVRIDDYQVKLRSAFGEVDALPRRSEIDLHAEEPIFADSKSQRKCCVIC